MSSFLVMIVRVMSIVHISVFAGVSSLLLVFVSAFTSLLMSLLGNDSICCNIVDLWWWLIFPTCCHSAFLAVHSGSYL